VTRTARLAFSLAMAAFLGCSREAPPPPASSASAAPLLSASPASSGATAGPGAPDAAAPPASARAPGVDAAADAGPPTKLCEVEISGNVRVPKKNASAPAPTTFVAIGDCLAPSPRIVGFGGTTNGRFFIEVFVPWGSDLTLCAASEPAPGEPSTLYGKAKHVMHAERSGEVVFGDVLVELAPGPPKAFAHRAGY
jgi:hypothetical protein